MSLFVRRASKKLGLKPGSVVFVGKKRVETTAIDVMDFTATELTEYRAANVEDCFALKDSPTMSWINITGIHDVEVVEKIGKHFDLHPLILEDIVNTGHRPKIEDTGDAMFIVFRMLYMDDKTNELMSEQVSVLFGKHWVITFQEAPQDVFNLVRERIRKTVPRLRAIHADYLGYALIDAAVDNYFVVLENISERIETLEDELEDNGGSESLETIRALKHELIFLRKAIWPLREVIAGLERSESRLINKMTRPYIRDLYEHVVQVIDTVETFRDMVSGLLDLYHTNVANRMNEIMKVLTIFAALFIPLGFLAGVFGMNFDTNVSDYNMPELSFRFGYIMFWALAVALAGGLLFYFKKKKWL